MSETVRILTKDELRSIYRYEYTFRDFADIPYHYGDEDIYDFFALREPCFQTLDDMKAALENAFAKNARMYEFIFGWYLRLRDLEERISPEDVADDEGDGDEGGEDPAFDSVEDFPLTDKQALEAVRDRFLIDIGFVYEDVDMPVADIPEIKEALDFINLYLREKARPAGERCIADAKKEAYILAFRYAELLEDADEEDIALARQYIEELIEKDNLTALDTKGFACYGGNRLYPCDWVASRDCLSRLFELNGSADAANALGYIYYYGRCTGGKPEYDKAFHMFTYAAANGLFEGMYKLGDMYRNGYGCVKSPKTARKLYGMVYEDSLEQFIKNPEEGAFADAALREGLVYLRGIGEEICPEAAYTRLLQADFAVHAREEADYYGNSTVAANIKKALDEAKALLPEDYFCPYVAFREPVLLHKLLEGNNRCDVSLKKMPDGTTAITLNRVHARFGLPVEPLLLTVPQGSRCTLSTRFVMTGVGGDGATGFKRGVPTTVDYASWNAADCCTDCYFANKLVGRLAFEGYILTAEEE